jgi:hypothetical protein
MQYHRPPTPPVDRIPFARRTPPGRLRFLVLPLVAAGIVACDAPAPSAIEPAEKPVLGHIGPAGSELDEHSGNVWLMANLPRPTASAQTHLAFAGRYAYAGSNVGFRIVDISSPANPVTVSEIACSGAQADLSVWANLLFVSVDTPQSSTDCESTNVTASTPGHFEGVRIFDISNPAAPQHIHSVYTDCGSHTHTLVPDPGNDRVFLYVSSYPLGGAAIGPNCQPLETGDGHSKISIVEVPLDDPAAATVTPYFLDEGTEWATYLGAFTFRACHDIAVFVEIQRAAAACMSEAQLWDISDPANPAFLWRYDNPVVNPANIDLFAVAAFSWDGTVVAFGDESGGGGAARCVDPTDDQGRVWFVDASSGTELGSYKIPRSEAGVCTVNGVQFVPLPRGRKVLVAPFYTGGASIVDVDRLLAGATEEEAEVGYYKAENASIWALAWYNGFVYANDINRGLDVMNVVGPTTAGARRLPLLNPQTQMQLIR